MEKIKEIQDLRQLVASRLTNYTWSYFNSIVCSIVSEVVLEELSKKVNASDDLYKKWVIFKSICDNEK